MRRGDGGVRARTTSTAANGEWHNWNVHHTWMRHNKTQPKGCFTAVFHGQNRDNHENHGSLYLRHYVFYLNMELCWKFQIVERLKSTAGANLVWPISRHLMVNGLWMCWWYLTTWGALDYRSAFTRSHRERLHHRHNPITGRSQGTAKSDRTLLNTFQRCTNTKKQSKIKLKKPGFSSVFSVLVLADDTVICGESQVGGMEFSCMWNERERWRLEGAEVSPERWMRWKRSMCQQDTGGGAGDKDAEVLFGNNEDQGWEHHRDRTSWMVWKWSTEGPTEVLWTCPDMLVEGWWGWNYWAGDLEKDLKLNTWV